MDLLGISITANPVAIILVVGVIVACRQRPSYDRTQPLTRGEKKRPTASGQEEHKDELN